MLTDSFSLQLSGLYCDTNSHQKPYERTPLRYYGIDSDSSNSGGPARSEKFNLWIRIS